MAVRKDGPVVMYLSHTGMMEPLGQSQVLAYLRGLSDEFNFILISFEKIGDAVDSTAVARVRADCDANGITWLPQRFRHRPKYLASLWTILAFFWTVLRESRKRNVRLIHARSYIPTFVAMVIGRLTGTPFIFDMRALWPEELIDAGRMKRDGLLHRGMLWAERKCLSRAAGVVSLTHAVNEHLVNKYPSELAAQRMLVIATCADLDQFAPAKRQPETHVYSCIGTVLSSWFRLDWLVAFFAEVAKQETAARFEIITRDDPDLVRLAVGGNKDLQSRLTVRALPTDRVPHALQGHRASVMFFTGGLSKLGSCPTRLGEILGSGLPVVANDGIGDVGRIVKQHRVGVLVQDMHPESIASALQELNDILKESALAHRCRHAAETVFSLREGTANYRKLYRSILEVSRK